MEIETYLELGFLLRKISQNLGRKLPPISSEIKWNVLTHNAIKAGQNYEMPKRNCEARSNSVKLRILEKL